MNFSNIKIKPRYLLIIAILIAILMVSSAYYEITSSRESMYTLLEKEANSIMKTVTSAYENTLLSNEEVENLIAENLFTAGFYIKDLSDKKITGLLKELNISAVLKFNKNGNLIFSNIKLSNENLNILKTSVNKIFEQQSLKTIVGIPFEVADPNYYFVAIRDNDIITFIGIDTKYFKEKRKKLGIGKLVQNMASSDEIKYIILQDEIGIVLASKNFTEINSIQSDSFLVNSILNKITQSRIFNFNGENVLEVVSPYIKENEFLGLFRIGIKLDKLYEMDSKMVRRIIIITIILISIAIIVISLLLINQHYTNLQMEYKKVRSYSDSILENMTDGILAISNSNKVLFANKVLANLFFLTESDLLNKSIDEIKINDTLKILFKSHDNLKDFEISTTQKEKNIILRISSSSLLNEPEKLDIKIFVIQDITEQWLLTKQIQRNEKLIAMGELAAGVAHEIRNPLNSIAIISQRLQYEFEPKEDKDSYFDSLNSVRIEIERLNSIIEQFLKFARKPKINPQKNNLSDLLNEIIKLVKNESEQNNIKINKSFRENAFAVFDKEQIKQALLNIIKNGFEAINKDGELYFSLTTNNKFFIIEIKDNGEGIQKENLSKIFNLYFSTKSNGAGIGLSMVNQIISEHNGKIEVDSEIGIGTSFKIYLPA